jgi:chloramphenicol 3-O phosphotransferase
MSTGRILLLNGASSAGKSTLARALQSQLPEPFWHWSIDHVLAAGVLPRERIAAGEFDWKAMRPAFLGGFHRTIPALAEAGNDLIVEHIVESADAMRSLVDLLAPFDVFYVGVRCPLPELERRELQRGDRRIGSARQDDASTHGFGEYDVEVDSTGATPDELAAVVLEAWHARRAPGAFARMAARAR